MSYKDKVFDALAIRDTATHNSDVSDCQGWGKKTIIVQNGLDQDVSIQVQGDVESAFGNPYDIQSAFTVTAGKSSYKALDEYHEFLRLQATASIAPTTGTLTAYILKSRE